MAPVYDGRQGDFTVGSRLLSAIAVFSLITGTMCARAQDQSHETPMGEMHKSAPPAGPLKITYGDQSVEWTPATLAALPHVTITLYNEHAKAYETYSGVPLTNLLTKLGVPDKPRGKQFRIYLVAAGSDGYEVVYSLGEVTPDVHDGTVLVADSEGGKPLADDGPLKLVATGEKRPARWVRNLVAVRVLTVE
ncbi:MAG TPA: hypothetical protein VHD85_10975 [Terracidiphilus sp.]|nr:hypothetical protein [Terracidiphilus sp.]